MAKVGTATKIIVILLALLAGGFLAQTGIYIYKIKTGKIGTYSFTRAKNSSEAAKINAAELISGKSPSFGSAKPELTIVEFGNYACPNSREEAAIVREMMIKSKDKVKFIYRDYPMDDIYPNSSALALAGKCAAEQNNILFWAMHDKLYGGTAPDAPSIASQIGLDKNKFSDCLAKQKYVNDLQKDLLDGYKNGVAGTPTFFFIKTGLESRPLKVQGAIPKATFEQIINNLLK